MCYIHLSIRKAAKGGIVAGIFFCGFPKQQEKKDCIVAETFSLGGGGGVGRGGATRWKGGGGRGGGVRDVRRLRGGVVW